MRERVSNQLGMNPRILWSGAILVAIGISVVLLAGEWFAAFDACLANPTCSPPGSVSTLEAYLSLMVAGVTMAVGGATIASVGWHGHERPAPVEIP